MNAELFDKKYKKYVITWVEIKNNLSSMITIDPNEFYSDVSIHLFIKDNIKYYVSEKSKFITWLNVVLTNLYLNLIKKQQAQKVIQYDSLDKMQEDTGFEALSYDEETENNEINIVIQKFNKLEPISARVLLKLKYYVYDLISFSDDEIQYMSKYYKGNIPLLDYINKLSSNLDDINKHSRVNKWGLRKEDIAELTEYAVGSINTTVKRIVTKLKI